MKLKILEFIKLLCKAYIWLIFLKILFFMFISTIVFWVYLASVEKDLRNIIYNSIIPFFNYLSYSLIVVVICLIILAGIKVFKNAKSK